MMFFEFNIIFQKETLHLENQLFRVVWPMVVLLTGKVFYIGNTWTSILNFPIMIFFDNVAVLNRAFDGKLNDDYFAGSCTHTTNEKSPWLVVDLLGPYEITHVKIKNRRDCCSKLRKLNIICENSFLVLYQIF